jgi:hypothetical protein
MRNVFMICCDPTRKRDRSTMRLIYTKTASIAGALCLSLFCTAANGQQAIDDLVWGVALDVRRGPFAALDGWWFSPGATADYALSDHWHLRAKATLVLSHLSGDTAGLPDPETYSLWVEGLMLRPLIGWDLNRRFALRLGPVAALLIEQHSSNICGDSDHAEVPVGGTTEFAVRFAQDQRMELGAQLDYLPVRLPRCTLVQDPTTTLPASVYGVEPEGNVGWFVGLTGGYRFP